ncbi:11387_t:CDS:2, partial [Scutellospora calospora]
MLYILVQVNEGVKCVIPERIMSMESTNKFFDLFDITTLGQYDDREVKVFIRREKSEGWREVDNRLDDTSVSTQDKPDAFSILMANSRRPLLPRCCTEHNNYNRLYNEIIKLFEAQQVGWECGSHNTVGKAFVNRLANALWYIDPHLLTLRTRSYHLPALFTQLKIYQNGESYDEYYYTSHHKKNSLTQQKLAHLESSLEISISQPWASKDRWNQVMPEVLSLIEILKKYSDYLITTAASMNELHHSNASARNPGNNSSMYQVSACEPHKLKDEYIQLDDLLFEKSFYEHVEIQQYLPNEAIERLESENLFGMVNTLGDIHKKAKESNKLESELKESIAGIQEILNNRTERLRLKNNKFKCYSPASWDAITEVFESILHIDPTLKIEETTQAQMRHHLALIEFINTHCQTRAYSFQ